MAAPSSLCLVTVTREGKDSIPHHWEDSGASIPQNDSQRHNWRHAGNSPCCDAAVLDHSPAWPGMVVAVDIGILPHWITQCGITQHSKEKHWSMLLPGCLQNVSSSLFRLPGAVRLGATQRPSSLTGIEACEAWAWGKEEAKKRRERRPEEQGSSKTCNLSFVR